MHIVFASDNGFVRQLLVASGSAVYASRGGKEPLSVHVLDCGIADATWTDYESAIKRLAAKCGANVSLFRHAIDMKVFANCEGWTNGSKAIWARVLIPELLPDVDRCVYSDCDMLFVANPAEMLEPLLRDSNVLIAGHLDLHLSRVSDANWCRSQGLPVNMDGTICSGLLAMNLTGFRAEGISEKCLDFSARHSNIPFPDQTTLNQVCFGRKAFLPDGWGVFPQECPSFNGPRIKSLHFIEGFPWKKRCATYVDAMKMFLTREACAIWHDFEAQILEVTPSVAAKPTMKQWTVAMTTLTLARLANLLHVRISTGKFQEFVACFDGRLTALSNMRQELFGKEVDL